MVFFLSLVIIHNLNIRRSRGVLEALETYAPLVIDTDGILPFAIPLEAFQTVGIEHGKVS
jgi:hypothetical protein